MEKPSPQALGAVMGGAMALALTAMTIDGLRLLAAAFWLVGVGCLVFLVESFELGKLSRRLLQIAVLGFFIFALWRYAAEEQRRALLAEGMCPFLARPMTDLQEKRFRSALEPGEQRHVRLYLYAEGYAPEARGLLKQLDSAFRDAGWKVDTETERGTGHGVRFLAYDANTPLVYEVQNAFQAAGVATYIQPQKGSTTLALEIQVGEPPGN